FFCILLHFKCIPWRLGNRQSVVQGYAAWNATEADYDAPHLIDCTLAFRVAFRGRCSGTGFGCKGSRRDQCEKCSSKLTNALHGKDSTHHCAAPFGGCKFGGDNTTEWIVAADTCFH